MISKGLIRISMRSGAAHPLRTGLMILGIALGVAGVVAIDIARTSVARSFDLSIASLTSRATHQIVGSGFKIDQALFTQLRIHLGVHQSAPIITESVRIAGLESGPLTLLGIDPFSESVFRDFRLLSGDAADQADLSDLIGSRPGVFVSRKTAAAAGVSIGDPVEIKFGKKAAASHVAGLLTGGTGTNSSVSDGLVLADISLAQEMLQMGDSLTRIDLVLEDAAIIQRVKAILPDGVYLVETDKKNEAVRGLSASFETSLAAFSMLALFMGIFLIYNTVSFSVARRRNLNGTLKALGVTRGEIFKMVMAEIMVYAALGSILGLVLGVLMGKGAVQAVCSTVSDMYFVLTVTATHIKAVTLVKGFTAGIAASFAASFFPAITASRTLPITLMQPSTSESELKRYIPAFTIFGVIVIALAVAGLAVFTNRPGADFIGVFMMFAGAAFLAPAFIVLVLRGLMQVVQYRLGMMFKMAMGNIIRSLSRTSVLIASLMVVVSVYIGIEVMTHSFRLSIIEWVDGHIGGHVHVSRADRLNRALDPDLLKKIQDMDTVEKVSAYNIHNIYSAASGEVHIFSYLSDQSIKRWTWTAVPEDQISGLLREGWIIVSEIFAGKHHIRPEPGASVILETGLGPESFKVAGIFRDFFMGGGRLVMGRDTMKTYFGYDDITSIQIFLKDTEQVPGVISAIQDLAPDDPFLEIESGADIKQDILRVFDNTFLITSALQVLTALVAFTGILNAVMALLLERNREMGILRACGARVRQVRRLMLYECGLNGWLAGMAALPLGFFLAWVLIYIVNQRSFGWTYDLAADPAVFVRAVLFSCLAAVAAGIFPAVSAGKTDIGKALRME